MKIVLKIPICEHLLLNSPLLKITSRENLAILNLPPVLYADKFHEYKIIPL